MASTNKYWGDSWLLTYDLISAPGISKRNIAEASKGSFMDSVKWNSDSNGYALPSTVLWAERTTFSNVEQVRRAFYQAFNSIKPAGAYIGKLLILDFSNRNVYIEEN